MIKTKQVLLALAVIGANVLHNMPLRSALAAEGDIWWYGTPAGFVDVEPSPAVTTGVNLTITDDTQVNGKTVIKVNKIIYGGYTQSNDPVTDNSINFSITDTTRIAAFIYGGFSEKGNVTNNTVTISNGIFSQQIHGGKINNRDATATAEKNAVTIDNGTFNGAIYGGFGGIGGVVENSLTINNGSFNAAVYGGDAVGSGAATKNIVTIYDGIFSGTNKPVYGAYSNGGDVTENEVTIKGGTFTETLIFAGCTTSSGNATGNKVTIEGGIFNNVKLCGGMGGTSSNNTLNLKTAIAGTATVVQNFQNVNFTLPEGATSEVTMLKMEDTKTMSLTNITFTTDLNGLSLTGNDYITLVRGVEGTEGALAGQANYHVLPIGGVKELVYSNGTPVAKADFEITTNGVKSAVGSKYYNDGLGSTDAIANTNKTYNHLVQGNVNFTTGIATTNYSNNKIIIRRGTYDSPTAIVGAYNTTTNDELTNNTVSIYDGTIKGAVYGANSTNGAVSGNTVNIYGGTLGESNTINIYGGYSNTNDATGNLTNIEGGTFSGTSNKFYFYGGYSENGKAGGSSENEGNKVIIDNITLSPGTNEIYGGYSNNGDACGNSVIINNGTFDSNSKIYGGYGDGTVGGDSPESGNKVIINNGTFNGEIYGGQSSNGIAANNSVTITEGTFNNKVYGGKGKTGAKNNILTISGGTFNSNILYGGYDTGNAENNIVNVKGGSFNGTTISAGASSSGIAEGNILNIEGGSFNGAKIYGGYLGSPGTSSNNELNLKTKMGGKASEVKYFQTMNFTLPSDITTGEKTMLKTTTMAFDTTNTTINVDAADEVELFENDIITLVQADGITGSYTVGKIFDVPADVSGGGYSTDIAKIATDGNSITLTMLKDYIASDSWYGTGSGAFVRKRTEAVPAGGILNIAGTEDSFAETKHFYGGYSKDDGVEVTGNIVTVTGGTFKSGSEIYGGYSQNGNAGNNMVNIEGDSSAERSEFYGGYSESGAATGNSVTVGNVNGTFRTVIGGSSTGGNAERNSVTINGGTITNVIYGGSSTGGNAESNSVTITDGTITEHVIGGVSTGGNATKNTVTISGGTLGDLRNVYAGGSSRGGNATDNTVTIEGGTFKDVFFSIYGGMVSDGKISSGNILNLKTKIGGKAAEIGYFQIMNFTLPEGIKAGETMLSTESVAFENTKINVDASLATLNDGDIITLIASDNVPTGVWEAGTVTGADGTITLSDNKLILTIEEPPPARNYDKEKAPVEGIAAAVQTVNMSADLASGEGMRSLILETVGGFTNTFGALTAGYSKYKTGSHVDVDGWGVVVGAGKTKEWGNGEATSLGVFLEYGKGNFDTYNGSIHGDGNSENKGIGFMMRHKMLNNTYYEGNIRYGKVETDWSESEVGGYNTDSKYYGISVGMGHIFPAGKNEIDVYGRYTYGHVGSSDARVGTKDYHFDSVKSHRVRIGGKYNFKQENSNAKPFVGLAWEHEFKGESKASIAGVGEAPAPSMKGNTGIMEVGCDWNLGKKWTAGISADAYVGKRKGWDGMARIFYNF